MPRYDHPCWDWAASRCAEHDVPLVPCPECLRGEGHPRLVVRLTDLDRTLLRFGSRLDELLPSRLHGRVDGHERWRTSRRRRRTRRRSRRVA